MDASKILAAKEVLDYDPGSGVMRWKHSRGSAKAGKQVGRDNGKGYLNFTFLGKTVSVHRMAWAIFHGEINPLLEIDHINGNRLDNRISNLRLVTGSQNNWNRTAIRNGNTASNVIGVSWSKRRNKWQAAITKNYKTRHLGYFHSIPEAKAAYELAKAELHKI